ncbi:sensor histidine kinase [Lentzea cavernae]|uniref:histidine kinase n=1 Tax=Lentzea cavernae TaxID=2020703 RepID=A0ABQ3M6E9_9PSEU|nr:histidine kinase [Lentzea cavernae]GHH34902.1 hypothetical protein GCM10017774_19630 [Lentzea cavernae]
MFLIPRDRDSFVLRAAVLGTGFEVLNFAYADGWGWVLAAVMTPALIVRIFWRTMPGWLLLAWVTVPTVVGDALVVTQTATMVVILALAIAAAGGRGRADTVAMVLCLVSPFFVWALGTNPWYQHMGAWLWSAGLLLGWVLGRLVGEQQSLIRQLERTQSELAKGVLAAERQRIARDLHDLVGHSFTVVLLHLSGARMNLTSSPGEAVEALRLAEETGRAGMDALREALALMYRGGGAPLPFRHDEVDRLVATYRDAGMSIDLDVTGAVGHVSATQRIVLRDVLREALTNVAKHAEPREAVVRIAVDSDRVTLEVHNPIGPRPAAPSTGIGLPGLRQRVVAVDGTFTARPELDRWVLRVQLPARVHTSGAQATGLA